MNKFLITIVSTALLAQFVGCTDFICGEPHEKVKTFIESVNSKFKDSIVIEHVPCYSDYMQIHLKGNYDESLIDSLEQSYEDTVWWAEFLVYDKNGKCIRGSVGSM